MEIKERQRRILGGKVEGHLDECRGCLVCQNGLGQTETWGLFFFRTHTTTLSDIFCVNSKAYIKWIGHY